MSDIFTGRIKPPHGLVWREKNPRSASGATGAQAGAMSVSLGDGMANRSAQVSNPASLSEAGRDYERALSQQHNRPLDERHVTCDSGAAVEKTARDCENTIRSYATGKSGIPLSTFYPEDSDSLLKLAIINVVRDGAVDAPPIYVDEEKLRIFAEQLAKRAVGESQGDFLEKWCRTFVTIQAERGLPLLEKIATALIMYPMPGKAGAAFDHLAAQAPKLISEDMSNEEIRRVVIDTHTTLLAAYLDSVEGRAEQYIKNLGD